MKERRKDRSEREKEERRKEKRKQKQDERLSGIFVTSRKLEFTCRR